MRKSERRFIFVLLAVLIGVFVVEWVRPKPLDWTPTFWRSDARPYGSEVLFEVLDDLVEMDVTSFDQPPYELLTEKDLPITTFVVITNRLNFGNEEAERYLDFVERGHTLFAAAHIFDDELLDSFNLDAASFMPFDLTDGFNDSTALPIPGILQRKPINLVNPTLRKEGGYLFREDQVERYFLADSFPSSATLLGVSSNGRPNFIRFQHGEGALFFSTTPLVFTNYGILTSEGQAYIEAALSYLPTRRIWWDDYTKPVRQLAPTPLRYVLSQRSLRSAYWLAFFTLLGYMFFEGRRRQRMIPIVLPERNTTLDFVETVGRLYFQRGDHSNLGRKMADHWLDYVRSNLNLATTSLDDRLWKRVADRAGVPEEDVSRLGQWVVRIQQGESLDEEALHRLSKLTEAFYRMSVR